jgi:LmbE family N-acetylglucosaminyl deacetylase
MIVTPRKEEQHADHCAAWFFVADALGDIMRVDRTYHPELLTYVIHFDTWPWSGDVPSLPAGSGWLRLRLTDQELQRKRDAVHKYKTQMKVMDSFLEAFVLPNEVFARPPSPRIQLPLRRSPCDQFNP